MKKIAFIGLFIFIIGVLGTLINWNQLVGRGEFDSVQHVLEFENEKMNTINITSDHAQVSFFQTDSEMIQIDVSGNSNTSIEELLTINESGETLFITVDHKSRFMNLSAFSFLINKNLTLEVGIPKDYRGSIEASVDVGRIQINDLSLDRFNGTVNVGNVVGNNLHLTHGSVAVDVGEIDLTEVTGEWDLATDVGEINLELIEWQGKIEAHTDIGDITVKIAEEPARYSLRLETELGEVSGVDHSIVEAPSQTEIPRLNASTDIGDIFLQWHR